MIDPAALYIVYDIETVPAANVDEFAAQADVKPKANLVDPKKIEADIAAKRQAIIDKAGLHWWTGFICCIGAKNIENSECFSVCDNDEKSILERFFMWLQAQRPVSKEMPTLIGKSSADFDAPFVVGRAMAHDIGVPMEFRRFKYADIDHIFGYGHGASQTTSLNNYAWGLGMEGKLDGMSGADVAGLFAAGEYEKIRKYCMQDVELTAAIWERYLKVF